MVGTLRRLPVTNRRKVGMTSSHHGPYGQGYTRTTMVGTEGCEAARWSQSQKADLSPDRSLQLDSVKSESLVIADQHCCGEYVPGPCTHRPSHHGSGLRSEEHTSELQSLMRISYAVFCFKKKTTTTKAAHYT